MLVGHHRLADLLIRVGVDDADPLPGERRASRRSELHFDGERRAHHQHGFLADAQLHSRLQLR